MKIDLTCPVELWQYTAPTRDTSECTFVLNNLSSKVVVSVLVTLACYDQENKLLFRQSERFQGLHAGVGERFSIVLLPDKWDGVQGMDLTVEKVWFEDATIWRRGSAPLAVYQPNALPKGRALDDLRFVAGQDAVGYPEVQGQVWLCVCGRANPLDTYRCCRCERQRESVFASYSKENVAIVIAVNEKKLADVAREAREDNSRIIEVQQTQKALKQKARKRAVKLGASLAGIAAVGTAAVVWGLPALRYQNAQSLLDKGQYQQARAAFADMGDYGNAQQLLLQCDYDEAARLLEAGDEASLSQAQQAFSALGDYQDSADQAKQADYRLGQYYLNQKLYDKAMDKFQTLGDYQDSPNMADRCVYDQAVSLLENGNESVALALFTTISSYEDAARQAQSCYYIMAQKKAETGEDEEAAKLFLQAGDYEDAAQQRSAAIYRIAQGLVTNGDLYGAGLRYLEIADYQDARAKANDCLYQFGQAEMAQSRYDTALEAFNRIVGYLDSEGQADICRYQQAQVLLTANDYAAAAELLSQANGYADSDTLLAQCRYAMAQDALTNEDYETAATLLTQLDGYENSVTLLRTARYQLAEGYWNRNEYTSALPLYEALGDYEDSRSKLDKCRYEAAKQAFVDADYTTAAALFAALGSYEDSRDWLANSDYQLASQISTQGDIEGALALLPEMSGLEQAYNRLEQFLLTEGQKLEDADSYQEAATFYNRIEGSTKAKTRYEACLYQLAAAQKQDGKLRQAGDAFLALGDFEDAAQQAQLCFDELYEAAAVPARTAMEQQDYAVAVAALRGVDLTDLPRSYKDLAELYPEACYSYAEELYNGGQVYQAMPFYQAALGYRDAASKLRRRAYLILGEWLSASDQQAVFRTDGTCDLLGETLYFRVNNFSLFTGTDPEQLTLTHRISSLTAKGMSLRDLREGKQADYKFSKTAEAEIPEMVLPQAALDAAAASAQGTETPAPKEEAAAATDAPASSTATPTAAAPAQSSTGSEGTAAPASTDAAPAPTSTTAPASRETENPNDFQVTE